MDAILNRQRLNLPIATLVAGTTGLIFAALFAVMPIAMIEDLAVDSGIAAVLSIAAPPLGFTARLAFMVLAGGSAGAMTWAVLYLLLGQRTLGLEPVTEDGERPMVLRRADAHPDAPARRPLSAWRDLGEPVFESVSAPLPADPEVEAEEHYFAGPIEIEATPSAPIAPPAEQALPGDLDQPLAPFDPAAVPDEPATWAPAPPLVAAPRRGTFAPDERLETFALNHAPQRTPSSPAPVAALDPSASIHALLDRLERSSATLQSAAAPATQTVAKPEPATRAESLEEALIALRRMAVQR